jgi:hypothetical protein
LAGHEEWVAERFRRHAGNADVVRQEPEAEKGIRLTLRTVEREVAHLRRELEAEARATIRFETPPGKQLQIDFGERRVTIGDENLKVYLFVATLGYSQRLYVRPFRNERQESWFAGLEGAFAAPACSRHRPRACRHRHDQSLPRWVPPAHRSARLVAVAARCAGPSCALPGQAPPTEPRGNAA